MEQILVQSTLSKLFSFSTRKEFAPKGSNCFLFRVDSFCSSTLVPGKAKRETGSLKIAEYLPGVYMYLKYAAA